MWLCSHCETTNQDTSETCDVCDEPKKLPTPIPVPIHEEVPPAPMPPPSTLSGSRGGSNSFWVGCVGVLVLAVLCFIGLIVLGVLWNNNAPASVPTPSVSEPAQNQQEIVLTRTSVVPATSLPSITPSSTKILVKNEDTPIVVTNFDWSKCHAKYATRLKGGDYVIINQLSSPFGYHVLEGPYKDRKAVGNIEAGDRARVIDGPSCSGGWIWWKIESEGMEGWFPEGDADNYWLSPVDQQVKLKFATISHEIQMVSLRRTPGYVNKNDTDVIVEIPEGERVRIISGPSKADGLNWWRVEWNGYEGWMAEKTASGKKILIFDS